VIVINAHLALDEAELSWEFVNAAGPGGQNVNKVASAVQLRWDAARSPTLTEAMLTRLARLAGKRLTQEGVLIITARRYRTQEANRQDALERLVQLLRQAALPPRPRHATRPTRAAQERRLEVKRRRGEVKRLRGALPE
jgi:ribosome-associated protein